jgi:hypothetical protein
MRHSERGCPMFSACGLNCCLCPRYHTDGASRCPGCGAKGFSGKHPSCGVLSCCRRKGLEYCYRCGEYPCGKYDNAGAYDSFITHKNQLSDFARAKDFGVDAYIAELDEKHEILKLLIANYDDGRRKSFFCLAVNLLSLADIKRVMDSITAKTEPSSTQKEKANEAARLLEQAAKESGIELKLRNKPRTHIASE